MFRGIIEEIGKLKRFYKRAEVTILEVEAKKVLEDSKEGESICVDGVCLTVLEKKNNLLVFEVIPHTLRTTTLGYLKINQPLNLERSLRPSDRISGHFVLGHIDCIGIIRKKIYREGSFCLEISIPKKFIRYCIPKGSVALDGISLTIAEVKSESFIVYIIPYTYKNTNLSFKEVSSRLNIEFDILIKAVLNSK